MSGTAEEPDEQPEDDEPVPDLRPCDAPPPDIHAHLPGDHEAALMMHYEVLRGASYWSEVAG